MIDKPSEVHESGTPGPTAPKGGGGPLGAAELRLKEGKRRMEGAESADELLGAEADDWEPMSSPLVARMASMSSDAATAERVRTLLPAMLERMLNRAHHQADVRAAARGLLLLLKLHGNFVYEHSVRLVELARDLARELGLDEEEEEAVSDGLLFRNTGEAGYYLTRGSDRQRAAVEAYLSGVTFARESVLHDVGKIEVPEEILFKPAPLTPDEKLIMRRHPVWGAEILARIAGMEHAVPVARHHHERWDGQGYPDGLAGQDIPLAARIVAIVDAFDAMVTDRPYRKALSVDEARAEIARGAGTQFDPAIAADFLRVIDAGWRPDV